MFRRLYIPLVAIALSLALPIGAGAHQRPRAHLSIHRGESMLRAQAASDRPTSVALSGCYKPSARSVACWVVEYGVQTYWTDNGQPIVADLGEEMVARA